jgi:perosamine synthetase
MIKNVGAKPVLVDINPDDYNISFEETQKHITKRTKAIIVPHMYGFPSDIEKFLELGIPIIENCALGIGAKYKNRKVGTFGEISVFSFNATKLLTTAKGGAVYSKNADMMEDIRDLTDILKKPEKPEYRLKFNYRMSDLQAALGITQLKKLDDFHRKRKLIAEQYNEIIARKSYANIIKTADYKDCAWYRYIIISEKNPEEITEKFREKGITTINPLENWELLHKRLGLSGKRFQNAEAITGKTVSIPIYPSLNNDEISKIKNAIDKIY